MMKDVSTKHILILLGGMGMLHAYLLFMTAWLCDDAFITFRCVDNFVQGYGPKWNVDERVQVFTHPFWFLLLSGCNALTQEMYATTLTLSILLSFSVLALLVSRIAVNWVSALTAVTLLTVSKAYMEYSTGGLENPLTHFLCAVFFLLYLKNEKSQGYCFLLFVTAGFLVFNRMDLLLLLLPALGIVFHHHRTWSLLGYLILGFLPFFMWELFSLVYYGFPFPNTAYAKLFCTGVEQSKLLAQGGYYLWNSLKNDWITLPIIIGGMVYPFACKKRSLIPFAVGSLLYMAYILKIGGDFMSGRLLTPPFLISVLCLSRVAFQKKHITWFILWVAVMIVGSIPPYTPIKSHRDYGKQREIPHDRHGIYDERAHYYQKTGLLSPRRWDLTLFRQSARFKPKFTVEERIGMKGYLAGPNVYILDYLALADPLLARLPAIRLNEPPGFRIAHFYRFIPYGYIETLLTGENTIKDARLARYYKNLRLIIRGPIWDRQRFKKIWKMNWGDYRHLIDRQHFLHPPLVKRTYAELPHQRKNTVPWFDPGNQRFSLKGLEISFEKVIHPKHARWSLDTYGEYYICFKKHGTMCFEDTINQTRKESVFLKSDVMSFPALIREQGFDTVCIIPRQFTNRHALGHFIILKEN